MDSAVASLIEHGYAVLFACVLVEQLALPIPSEPVLLAGGALAGGGHLRLGLTVGVAVLGCLLTDGFWYAVGRIRGRQVMRFLCRIALEPGTIIEDAHLRVRAVPVTHRGADSFGFVFEEKSRPRMLPDRLAALDVPAGPERRRLLGGEEVVLPDGRRISPDEVLGPPQRGARQTGAT